MTLPVTASMVTSWQTFSAERVTLDDNESIGSPAL